MTKVSITHTDGHTMITAYDHATGSSEVCSAISCLMYTLEGWLINHESLVKNHRAVFEDGYAVVEFDAKSYEVYTILGFVILGFMQIENTYSDYIKTKIDSEILAMVNYKN